jgi:DNA-binding GntR family transcriptional regulator
VDAGDVAMVSEGVSYDISGNAIEYARNISRADFAGYTFKF